MKGFSIFLAVLIFLLAAVSAVFSFFLYEKRGQLVDGWNDMAAKINAAAVALDAGSGTSVAAALTPSAMDQTKYADLPKLLPQLPDLATKVITERDALANALVQLGGILEMRGLNADQFEKLDAYPGALANLAGYVSTYQARTNAILARVAASAQALDANVSVDQLKSSGYANAYQSLDNRISYYKKRHNVFNQRVQNIASAIGAQTPNLNEQGYESSLSSVVSSAQSLKRQAVELDTNLKNAQRSIKNLEQVVSEKNGQIENLKTQLARKDKELLRICRVLGLEAPKEPMAEGSAAALQLVKTQEKGKVMDVDDKFGFLVISLGHKTRVEEPFGNRINYVDPMIPQGAVLTIARNMPSGDAEYINKVKLVKVDDNCSIGELVDNQGGKRPKVGDLVYFGDDEIAKIVKDRK